MSDNNVVERLVSAPETGEANLDDHDELAGQMLAQ